MNLLGLSSGGWVLARGIGRFVLSDVLSCVVVVMMLCLMSGEVMLSCGERAARCGHFDLLGPSDIFFIMFFALMFTIECGMNISFIGCLSRCRSMCGLRCSGGRVLCGGVNLFLGSVKTRPSIFFKYFIFLRVAFFLLTIGGRVFMLPFLVVFLFTGSRVRA